jgi:hypothetical protein
MSGSTCSRSICRSTSRTPRAPGAPRPAPSAGAPHPHVASPSRIPPRGSLAGALHALQNANERAFTPQPSWSLSATCQEEDATPLERTIRAPARLAAAAHASQRTLHSETTALRAPWSWVKGGITAPARPKRIRSAFVLTETLMLPRDACGVTTASSVSSRDCLILRGDRGAYCRSDERFPPEERGLVRDRA